jgi:hypothetical protein
MKTTITIASKVFDLAIIMTWIMVAVRTFLFIVGIDL